MKTVSFFQIKDFLFRTFIKFFILRNNVKTETMFFLELFYERITRLIFSDDNNTMLSDTETKERSLKPSYRRAF